MKLKTKKNKYVTILYDLSEHSDWEIYGREAMLAAYMKHEYLTRSYDLVISSFAFDDFIIENNLSEKITKILENVRPLIRETAKNASEQINNLIMNSHISQKLLKEITDVLNLSRENNLANPILNLRFSNVMPDKVIPKERFDWYFNNDTKVIQKVLLRAFTNIFSVDAIEMRVNSYYRDVITTALILKFIPRAEASGEIFFNGKDKCVLKAFYGVKLNDEIQNVDTFEYELTKNQEISKNIFVQKTMSIFTGVSESGTVVYSNVEVSEQWQSRPKLNDDLRNKIYKIFSSIYKKINHPIKFKFFISTGNIYGDSIFLQDNYESELSNELSDKSDMRDFTESINLSVELQNVDAPAVETVKETENSINDNVKNVKLDIQKLASEVEEMVENKQIVSNTSASVGAEVENSKDIQLQLKLVEVDSLPANNYSKRFKESDLYVVRDAIFNTKIFIELSRLTPSRVASLKHFYGSFVDGTELILQACVLPESPKVSTMERSVLVDRFAQHVFAAAKSVQKCIYMLSDIDESRYLLLDEESPKYISDYRLLHVTDALTFEVSIIKRFRNIYEVKNTSLCLPASRNLENVLEIKKLLHSKGIRKSSGMQIYLEVGYPIFVEQIGSLSVDEFGGIILNLNKLYSSYYHRSDFVREDLNQFAIALRKIIMLLTDKGFKIFFMAFDFDLSILEMIYEYQFEGLIFTNLPSPDVLEYIWEKEKKLQSS